MSLDEQIRRFKEWQRTPPATEPVEGCAQVVCQCCGESFDGRFCPRCGQKGDTQHFSIRNVTLSFLDVWGAGNRSMFRNLLHLLLRPGYMVADYLRGCRQPYFPPFKMLFVVVALALLVTHGIWWLIDFVPEESRTMVKLADALETAGKSMTQNTHNADLSRFDNTITPIITVIRFIADFNEQHEALMRTLGCCVTAALLYFAFPRPRNIHRLNYTEQVVAQVFFGSQLIILSMAYFLLSLIWVRGGDQLPMEVTSIVYLIDFKQLFGYSWWGTTWRLLAVAAAYIILNILIVLILIIIIAIPLGEAV